MWDKCKINQLISVKLSILIGPTPTNGKNRLTVGGDLVLVTDQFSTPLIIAEWGILGHLLAFPIQSSASFHDP